MAHHKRRRPANSRAGCKMCKPWKDNTARKLDHFTASEKRRLQEPVEEAEDEIEE